jgi:hypothetical protein
MVAMSADPMDERRCTATSKRSGERCRRAAIVGGTVCAMHGGKAPAVAAAAEQRETEHQAEATIAKLWPGLAAASPVKDPVDQMERLAGALTSMLDVIGAKVNDLEHLAGGVGLTQLRGELVLLDKVAGHLRQLLADMARLGIAERQVRLEEEQAAIITAAFRTALGLLGERVVLLPADRDLVVRTFLEQLGQRPALEPGGAA